MTALALSIVALVATLGGGLAIAQTIIEVERSAALADAPEPMRKALMAAASGGTVSSLESVERKGTVTYEAVIKQNGHPRTVALDAGGQPLKPAAKK